jgi:hypothetical protein
MRSSATAARLALPCCSAVCRSCGMTALVSTSCRTSTSQSWVKCAQVCERSADVFSSLRHNTHAYFAYTISNSLQISLTNICNRTYAALIKLHYSRRPCWQQHIPGAFDACQVRKADSQPCAASACAHLAVLQSCSCSTRRRTGPSSAGSWTSGGCSSLRR